MRLAARVDATQKEIVSALRKAGYRVLHLHTLGRGVPDLLIGSPHVRRMWLLECKVKGGTLTPDQVVFHDEWRGLVHVVKTAQEALRVVMGHP